MKMNDLGPGCHHRGGIFVLQFHHASDHRPRLELEYPPAVPLVDDRQDLIDERLLVVDPPLGAADESVQEAIEPRDDADERPKQDEQQAEHRPDPAEKRLPVHPGDRPGQDHRGQQHQQPHAGDAADQPPDRISAVVRGRGMLRRRQRQVDRQGHQRGDVDDADHQRCRPVPRQDQPESLGTSPLPADRLGPAP